MALWFNYLIFDMCCALVPGFQLLYSADSQPKHLCVSKLGSLANYALNNGYMKKPIVFMTSQ